MPSTAEVLAGQDACEHLMHLVAMQHMIGGVAQPMHRQELAAGLEPLRHGSDERLQYVGGEVVADFAEHHQIEAAIGRSRRRVVLINLYMRELAATLPRPG